MSYPHFPLTKVCYWLSSDFQIKPLIDTFFWSLELSSVSWLQWMIQKKHCWKDPFHIINYLNTFQANKENTPSGQNKFCLPLKLPFCLQNKVLTSLCHLVKEVSSFLLHSFPFDRLVFFLFGFYTLLCDELKRCWVTRYSNTWFEYFQNRGFSTSYKDIVGKVVKLVPAEFGPTLWSMHKLVDETNLN